MPATSKPPGERGTTLTKRKKPRRLAHQLLGMIGLSALVATALFWVMTTVAGLAVSEYCFQNDIDLSEFDWLTLDRWIFTGGGVIALGVFSALFLMLLARHMAYIRTITRGIDALGRGEENALALEDNNELTALADAINRMSDAQRQLREKEAALAREKEQFVRTLSHDIRTPLTSILAYSEYLSENEVPAHQRQEQLLLIRKKAEQIKDLTDILLDGNKRNVEHFADAHLLMQQLAAEFEEGLEDFRLEINLERCGAFAGSFDVQELRRIFDNLSTNIHKYAHPAQPVQLEIRAGEGQLEIRQRNALRGDATGADSHGLGLHSIRRIAQFYHGQVTVRQDGKQFEIEITLNTGAG